MLTCVLETVYFIFILKYWLKIKVKIWSFKKKINYNNFVVSVPTRVHTGEQFSLKLLKYLASSDLSISWTTRPIMDHHTALSRCSSTCDGTKMLLKGHQRVKCHPVAHIQVIGLLQSSHKKLST